MKKSNYTTVLKRASVIVTMMLILMTTVAAQNSNDGRVNLDKWAVKNLIQGVAHENDGVRKASIYYTGLFRVEQAVDALVEQLKTEKYPNYRQLIVLSLYMIGDSKGLSAIYQTADTDPSPEVKQLCSTIKSVIGNSKTLFAISRESK